MKQLFKTTALAALMAGATSLGAWAQDVTLTIHHFVSPKAPPQSKFMEPWAEKVMAESDGRIKIEIFPSMSLGGKPPELYSQARDGAADIVWTVTGYTPGVFPRSEVFELPSVHEGSAEATSKAIYDNWDLVKEDFADIHPLAVYVHAGQAFHVVGDCLTTPADYEGKKLRVPSRTGGWMIEALGAEGVGMPLPAFPQALSKKAVDGGMLPFEIVPPYKVHELTDCTIQGEDGRRFGTAVFLFGMNKDKYNSLPDDLKAIIDANSGASLAAEAGLLWDGLEAGGQGAIEGASKLMNLDAAGTQAMLDALSSVEARWIEEATANGLDGAGLVAAAKASVQGTN
ncbi:MAG: TRAP transporter substrate-binding protein [Pseudomonadota bacterium]